MFELEKNVTKGSLVIVLALCLLMTLSLILSYLNSKGTKHQIGRGVVKDCVFIRHAKLGAVQMEGASIIMVRMDTCRKGQYVYVRKVKGLIAASSYYEIY